MNVNTNKITANYMELVKYLQDTLNNKEKFKPHQKVEIIQDFKNIYATNNFTQGEIIQAGNEMNLEMKIYNLLRSNEDMN